MEDDTIKNLDDDSLMELLSELEELDDVCDELIKEGGVGNEELR